MGQWGSGAAEGCLYIYIVGFGVEEETSSPLTPGTAPNNKTHQSLYFQKKQKWRQLVFSRSLERRSLILMGRRSCCAGYVLSLRLVLQFTSLLTILQAGVGGWANMENFITGFPGREYQIRQALAEVLGKEKAKFFFDKVYIISFSYNFCFLFLFVVLTLHHIVPRILLHRRRCKILQVPWTQLHSCSLQLPTLRR